MQFAVRTLGPDLSIDKLVVDASDEADARRQAEARGLFVSGVVPVRTTLPIARHRSRFSLVLFSQELLVLLTAGLGIVEGLEALLEKEGSPATQAILSRLVVGLREGKRLSGVLAEQPAVFPLLFVGIVRAAEGTSDLPRALERYVEYQQRIDAVRSKVVSASIYPLILILVGGGVSIFLMTYVVPRFAEVYQGTGRSLPALSRLMLEWGQFATRHAGPLMLAIVTALVLAMWIVRRLLRGGGVGRLLRHLPGIGDRALVYELSRLYLTLGMLSEGGISVLTAIDIVQTMVSSSMAKGLREARAAVESGRPLSDAFEANGLTTPISSRMLRVGERTGEIGVMLTRSAAFYDGEIGRWIDRFTRTFEPLLMAAIGLIVGAIVVLLYMPIFDLAGDMS